MRTRIEELTEVVRLRYLLFSLLVLTAGCGPAETYTLEIPAPEQSRPIAIVSFEMPRSAQNISWEAVAPDGAILPAQIDENGLGLVVVADLIEGQGRTLALQRTEEAVNGIYADEHGGIVSFYSQNSPIVAYHAEKQPLPREDIDPVYHRSGYLHPVYSPSGRMVTDDYPPNHVHHHGIWSAWTQTFFMGRGPDFWNMGAGTGRVVHLGIDSVWAGSVYGGLKAQHLQVDLSGEEPVDVLEESWNVRVYKVPEVHLFDLSVAQELMTDSTLRLLEHHYGGVGFRGARGWDGAENTVFLTSEGLTRSDGHATRARWCHIGGLVDGEITGIAILGHPENHEAPQPMRIHPDEPFFNYAPTQAGTFDIGPQDTFLMRYRYVVYDGEPDPDFLEALWQDYAAPLVGTVTR